MNNKYLSIFVDLFVILVLIICGILGIYSMVVLVALSVSPHTAADSLDSSYSFLWLSLMPFIAAGVVQAHRDIVLLTECVIYDIVDIIRSRKNKCQ